MKKRYKLLNYFIVTLLFFTPFFTLGTNVAVASNQASAQLKGEQQHTVEYSIVISDGEVPLSSYDVEITEGDTVLDALVKATEGKQIDLAYSGQDDGAYVEGIDGVFEFDRGPGSGWMYRVNGIFPNRGAGVIKLVPGDQVEWLYTTDLGQDIGAELQSFRDNLDPTIVVTGISNNETVYNEELHFQIEASSYFGTTLSPIVKVNDVDISPSEGNNFSVDLQEGVNTIRVQAGDLDGRSVSQTYTIQYEKTEEKTPVQPTPGNGELEIDHGQITSAIEKASDFILAHGVNSEWEAIGLARAGVSIPSSYIDVLNQNVEDQITNGLENGRIKITDIERIALAAVAIGLDPTDIGGKNLIELIYNSPERRGGYDTMTFQGNNGPIFALVALDSQKFSVPEDAKWTRQMLIDELLRTQNADGSWSLNEMFNTPSVDITGMALIGLSPYKDQPAVKEALDRAVEWLSSVQTVNGGFDGGDFVGGITSEATSQVIIGLTAYGIDPTSDKFTKNGNNIITHFLEFQNPDGGFKHTMDYDYSDAMGTEQALQALVAYDLFLNGKGNLYHFGQLDNEDDKEESPEEETPVDNEDDQGEDATSGNEENKDEEVTPGNQEANHDKEEVIPGNKEDSTNNEITPGNIKQVKTDPTESGKKLPDTASNLYNFLFFGTILMLIGGVLLYLHIRKQTKLVS
ncbi:DUF4430 domain-containing protein [Paucisalibacillus globulus]|uniref:DUF4430 domain-containing protein n=1 Tax=Paucisalibacillus globulus TaxID=351095 RepID=UPI0004031B8D|nr:DUF4430 domain-containing protein [Paucisalibacillus globulus]